MGQEGRKQIEQSHTLEQFVDGVERAVAEAIAEVRGHERRDPL
jgi:hypothetical protein